MSKTYKYEDGRRVETFLCGCVTVTTYVNKKANHEWTKCPLHRRADELKNKGMNIHDALTQSLFEQIAIG